MTESILNDLAPVLTNLPNHAGFLNRLPAFEKVFNPEVMRERFQRLLFEPGQTRYTVESCKPGKAIFRPGDICPMQFVLQVRDSATGQIFPVVINARLAPEVELAHAYRRKYLDPLVPSIARRAEFLPFQVPLGVIDDLSLVYSVYPLDGEIPTLLDATNPNQMVQIFNRHIPEAQSGDITIDGFQLEPAHYGRYQRAVIRYRLQGHSRNGRPKELVVYGKVDSSGLGATTVQVIQALRDTFGREKSSYSFRIPQVLAYLPDLDLLVMEAVQGSPLIADLLEARVNGNNLPEKRDLELEGFIKNSAHIAAAFHSSGLKLGRIRTFEVEISHLQEILGPVQKITPEIGIHLADWLDQAIQAGSEVPAFPLTFSHGDFTYTQLIFSGEEAGLVDFDTVCQAEPALDLGQFLAYQRLTIQKEQPPQAPFPPEATEELCELFLSTYIQESRGWIPDEQQLRARVRVYELLSLMRLVIHAWQKLKGARLHAAIAVLEGRIECLKQAI